MNLMGCADAQIAFSNCWRDAGDRDACGERRRSEPARADQYDQRAGGRAAACWEPPPIGQSRPGMQITVLMSFKRNGELFGQPRITFQSRDASDAERASYQTAVAETLKRCASLPFTEAFGNGIAGEPLTMRFVDDRKGPPD